MAITTIITTRIIAIGINIPIRPRTKGPQNGKVINKKTIAANSRMKT